MSHVVIAPGRVLVTVKAKIANKGPILVRVSRSFTRILQIVPPGLSQTETDAILKGETPWETGETALGWQMLGERDHTPAQRRHEIEPGEVDEVVFDFIIPDSVKSVRIYTYLENI